MTADEFRRLALSLEGASEGAHHAHADFRVGGRIFATLGWPDADWAVVMLDLDEREPRVEAAPEIFSPVPGGWGKHGHTRLYLPAADEAAAKGALKAAHRLRMAKPKARSRKV